MRSIARKEFDIVHKTIMEVGKRQFLEKGYEGANLRDLCKAADITTSTFYCHFGDKHTLLSELVEEAVVGFEQLLRSCLDEISKMVDECPENFYTEHFHRDIPLLLDYIYRYFDSFKLLVSCGQRNEWKDFIRRLAIVETEYVKKISAGVWFSKHFLEEMMVFIHYSFYAGLFETVIHNIPKIKAESIVKPLAVYQIKGWNRFAEEMEVMGLGELGKSQEDYLEAILVLQNQHSEVLSVDVARHMNFSKPSVCHAVKQLKGKGFLDVYEDGSLHLTEEGRKLAEGVYERHRFFTEYLMEMGVSAKQAEEDACKMEHIISEESFRALKMGLKKERGDRKTHGD